MSGFARRYPLLAYWLLAFGIAWTGWIPAAVAPALDPELRLSNPLLSLSLFACGPSLGALLVTGARGGWPAVRSLLGRLLLWRVPLRWYLFIGSSPAVLFLAGAWLRAAATGTALDLKAGAIFQMTSGIGPWVLLPLLLVSGLFIGPLNEEIGWRGFALPELQRRWSPLTATLILGAVWGLWHLPLFFIPGMSQAAQPFLPFVASVMANAFFYTWVHNRTGGSLLLAVLLHDVFNSTSAYMPAPPSDGWVILVTALATALLVLLTWRSWRTAPA